MLAVNLVLLILLLALAPLLLVRQEPVRPEQGPAQPREEVSSGDADDSSARAIKCLRQGD